MILWSVKGKKFEDWDSEYEVEILSVGQWALGVGRWVSALCIVRCALGVSGSKQELVLRLRYIFISCNYID